MFIRGFHALVRRWKRIAKDRGVHTHKNRSTGPRSQQMQVLSLLYQSYLIEKKKGSRPYLLLITFVFGMKFDFDIMFEFITG
jgi:hypothetical protein